MAKARKLKPLEEFQFNNSQGKKQTLADFLSQEDYHIKEGYIKTPDGKRKKGIVGIYVKHNAVKRLAAETGIIISDIQMLVTPQASNEQQHLILGKFEGSTNRDRPTIQIGEASTRNTSPGVSRNYIGSMAFKRLHDRGVLNHLGFYNLYSEDEADEFHEEIASPKIKNEELDEIRDLLNKFSMAETIKDLDVAKKEAVKRKPTLSGAQINYLRDAYKKCLVDLEFREDPLKEDKPTSKPANTSTIKKPTNDKPKVEKPQEQAKTSSEEPLTGDEDDGESIEDPLADALNEANADLELAVQESEKKIKG